MILSTAKRKANRAGESMLVRPPTGDVYCKDCKHLVYNGMSVMPYICYGVKVKTFLEKIYGNPQEINKNNNCESFKGKV